MLWGKRRGIPGGSKNQPRTGELPPAQASAWQRQDSVSWEQQEGHGGKSARWQGHIWAGEFRLLWEGLCWAG